MRRGIISGFALMLIGSCLVELEGDTGWWWCIEATGANGTRTSTSGNVNILRGGDWTSGCMALCEAQNTIMEQGEDGDYDESHPLYPQWQTLRDQLITVAEGGCEARVDELETGGAINFSGVGDVTCAAAVASQEPAFWHTDKIFVEGSCDNAGNETGSVTTGPNETGSPDTTGGGAVGPDIYGLTAYNQVRSCSTNTATKTIACNVDQEFIKYVAENPMLLWSDDATMDEATVGSVAGWKFITCGTTSLMYSIGFRQNDVITKVDSTPVTDYGESLSVFGQFANPLFGGTTVSGKFYRGTVLWTFTMTRVNNPNYP